MSWRLLMGTCALAIPFSAFAVGQFVPSQHGAANVRLAAQRASSTRSVGGGAHRNHGAATSAAKVATTGTAVNGTARVPANTAPANSGQTGGGASSITANAATWSPQPAVYGTGSVLDQPVTMADGTVLRADVYFPTAPGTTTAAAGHFPVLLQQTPYGKAFIVYAAAIAQTDVNYLVDRGYIVVIADVRGTGDSGGTFDLFDPTQSTDGVTLADWAAHLPLSN
ncbi:MAG TPA: CocE/NonD family hydrolase, partial [Acidimicrobiales bacterium]|nr:CocE/NonD family hydrolase [Acidimicrobiales bacterium]